MILTFNRGVYCPKDRQQLLQLADFSKQCAVGYTRNRDGHDATT